MHLQCDFSSIMFRYINVLGVGDALSHSVHAHKCKNQNKENNVILKMCSLSYESEGIM